MPQIRKCFAKGCKTRRYRGSEVKLHAFPRNAAVCREWITFSRNPLLSEMPLETVNKRAYLCEKHFPPSQYACLKSRKLIYGALPSIFPSDDESNFPVASSPPSAPPSPSVSSGEMPSSFSIPTQTGTTVSKSPFTLPVSVSEVNPSTSTEIHSPNSVTIYVIDNLSFPLIPGSSYILPGTSTTSSKRKAQRASVLNLTNESKVSNLTPHKRKLHREKTKKARDVQYQKSKCKSTVRPEDLFRDVPGYIEGILEKKLGSSASLLITSHLRHCNVKQRERRWTLKEKLHFLILSKLSPRTYLFLKSKYSLPSKPTLFSILNKVPFKAGINPEVFSVLSSCVSLMEDCDKYCSLLFDEMSVRQSLVYNSRSDRLEGFTDYGNKGRFGILAGEALVFMIRGLKQKWKQPVAFYFSESATLGLILADLIKEVLGALQDTGLKIVATVCDMGSNNTKALKILGSTTQNPFFHFNGQCIFTIHDTPHLLKCTRNMFLKHSFRAQMKIGKKVFVGVGRWSHIRKAVSTLGPLTYMDKRYRLTSSHYQPQGKEKMSVHLAAQVFNPSLAGVIGALAIGTGLLPKDAHVTSSFLTFVHKLFVSLNGDDKKLGICEGLGGNLRSGSPHFKFWRKAIPEIKAWHFQKEVCKNKKIIKIGQVRPKCQNGWIISIRAVELLWNKLKDAGFDYLAPCRLNQDPLENLFGSIQLHCGANHNPNVEQFASALKLSIIGVVTSQLLRGNNCEPDEDEFIADLEMILQRVPGIHENTNEVREAATSNPVCDASSEEDEETEMIWSTESFTGEVSNSEVSCRIINALLRSSTCSTCLSLLTSYPSGVCANSVSLYVALHFNGRLLSPSERFVKSLRDALIRLGDLIPQVHTVEGIGEMAENAISESVFSWLVCDVHKIKARTVKQVVRYALHHYCFHFSRMYR